jgi:hypothetical protein
MKTPAQAWLNYNETLPLKALTYRELARAVESSGRILVRNCGKRDGVIAWIAPGSGQLLVELRRPSPEWEPGA